MPCGCGGSTQQASTRRQQSTRAAQVDTRPVSVTDPSLYWNGPKRTVEPTQQHTRRQG